MITLPQGWDGANNFHIHNFSEKIPNWRTSLTAFFAMRIRHISIRFSEVTCFEDLITCPVEVIVAYQRRIPESEIFLLAWNVQERWVLGWLPHDKREGFLHSPICEAPTHTVSIEILGPFTKSARLGISKIYTTAYHPQTNAFNRFISTNLSLHTQKKPERLGLQHSSLSRGVSNSCSWCHRFFSVFPRVWKKTEDRIWNSVDFAGKASWRRLECLQCWADLSSEESLWYGNRVWSFSATERCSTVKFQAERI